DPPTDLAYRRLAASFRLAVTLSIQALAVPMVEQDGLTELRDGKALFGQSVLDSRRPRRYNPALDKPQLLEGLQLLRQDSGRDPLQAPAQLLETHSSQRVQKNQDFNRPLA